MQQLKCLENKGFIATSESVKGSGMINLSFFQISEKVIGFHTSQAKIVKSLVFNISTTSSIQCIDHPQYSIYRPPLVFNVSTTPSIQCIDHLQYSMYRPSSLVFNISTTPSIQCIDHLQYSIYRPPLVFNVSTTPSIQSERSIDMR